MVTVVFKYRYVQTYIAVRTTAKILNYCLGLFSVDYEQFHGMFTFLFIQLHIFLYNVLPEAFVVAYL